MLKLSAEAVFCKNGITLYVPHKSEKQLLLAVLLPLYQGSFYCEMKTLNK